MSTALKMKFCGFIETVDQIWFFNRNFNALFCVNKINGKIEKIVKVPDGHTSMSALYSAIFKIGDNLICIPDWGDKIISYNINDNSFFDISLRDCAKIPAIANYKAAYQYKDEIFMFPQCANNNIIIAYNTLERKVSTIKIDSHFLKERYHEGMKQFQFQFEILGEYIFIPFAEVGAVLVLNLMTKQIKIRWVNGLSGCNTINYHDGIFYLASWDEKKIYAVNRNFVITNEYTDFPDELKASKYIFRYAFLIEEKILYFPQAGNMILSFNLKDKTIKEEMRIKTQNANYTKTYLAKIQKNEIIALMTEDLWLSVFFFHGGTLHKRPYCQWNNEYNSKVIEKFLIKTKYFDNIYENSEVGLNMFVDILGNAEYNTFYREYSDYTGKTGEKIYRHIVGEKT